MIMNRTRRFRTLTLGPVVAATCGLLLLAGCSGSGTNAGAQPSAAQNGGGGQGGQSDPGRVSGEIAAVDGKTLQIQDGESQTAVTYTSKTTFTAQVAGTVSDVSKGDCVTVFSSSSDEDATEITATTLTASSATDGSCSNGFGGAGGGGGAGNRPSDQPSGMPSGQPSGVPDGGGRPQSGEVTAVDGDTLTVAVSQQGSDDSTDLTVTTTSDTTVTVTEKSKASAAKVGVCATVSGKADDTGAVTATTISLRGAGDDGCSMRRGNR